MPRVAIFREAGEDKDDTLRVHGVLTREDYKLFNQARAELANLHRTIMGREPQQVSDADTVAFLLRGPRKSREYLLRMKAAF